MNSKYIILAVAVIILLAGTVFVMNTQQSQSGEAMQLSQEQSSSETQTEEKMMKQDEAMMEEGAMQAYTGTVLAGTSSPYLDFKQSDYEAALQSGKVVLLNFYANWCPICRAEAPAMVDGFNGLTTDNVIGFRVNYNDSETDQSEKDLAREHGITYQHTKVIIQNGKTVYKATEQWDKNKTIETLNSY